MKLLKQPWFIIALFLLAVYGYFLSDKNYSFSTPQAIASESSDKVAEKKEVKTVDLTQELKAQDVQNFEVTTYQNLNVVMKPSETQSMTLSLKGKSALYKGDASKISDWLEVKMAGKKLSIQSFKNNNQSMNAKKLKDFIKGDNNDEELVLTLTFPKSHNFKKITVSSVSSNVDAQAVSFNEMTLESVSGDVQFAQGKGENINVTTVSGKILLNDLDVTKGAFKSVSGDANLKVLAEKPNFSFSTVSGDLKLSLPSSASVNVKFESMTGELQNEFGRGTDGAGQLDISSLSGDASVIKTK